MEKKTYYILLRDLQDPSTQSSGMLWGMSLLSNYMYGTPTPLVLKGELFESLPADEQPREAEGKCSVRGLKQRCLQVECPLEDLTVISEKEANMLLAVQSYHKRCSIVSENRSLLDLGVAGNEGCQVSVWMDDMKKDVAAAIRYVGAVPPYDGIMFGIEIMDPLFRNRGTTDGTFRCQRYFNCAARAGLFVSLDKISIPSTEETEMNSNLETENIQDDYAHVMVGESELNGHDSGMESSGHSIMEAGVLDDEGHFLDLGKNLSEQAEGKANENESEDLEELLTFKDLYLKENKTVKELQNVLKESTLKISSLEKDLCEERAARERLIEKCNSLQKALSEQVLQQTETEFQLVEQREKIQKMQKCFMSEWQEIEKCLIEERASKEKIEQQLSDSLMQLEREQKLNVALKNEKETLARKHSCQEGLEQPTEQQDVSTVPVFDSSHCEWLIDCSEVEVVDSKSSGTGAWGVVKEGRFRGSRVAVKQIRELILSPHNRHLFMREMTIAFRCRHPCLLQFIGATNNDGVPLIITELMDASLRDLLKEQLLRKADVINIALDVARALNYMHLSKPPIIHLDLSSANVLLWRQGNQWRAKVSDNGPANFMRKCKASNSGSVIYSAPEALSSKQSPKLDVYSFGLLLCEMCICELPVPERMEAQISFMTDEDLRELVRSCVRKDPKERPSMAEVLLKLESVDQQ